MDVGLVNNSQGTAMLSRRPRRLAYQTATASVLWTVAIANVVVIVWLWLSGGGISAVHGLGDFNTSVGRVTGLLSAYLALIQVLLLARLPWLERLVGFDRLTVWHRLNGKVCLILVLAHVVFITVGYAAMDKIAIPAEVSRLLDSYPGMVAATIGTGLMIAVVITSLVIVRRRLQYEAWYAVHLTAYAGIALAWVHQVPTGNELTANVAASNYWTALYVVTLALLVFCRLAVPIFHAFWYGMRVAEVTAESPNVVSLRITGRNLNRLKVRPGQFFLWRFLGRGRWWASHPFSLSAAPDGRSLRITVKKVGDFTSRIDEIAPGTRVVAEGPFGVFTDAVRRRNRVLLVAGGIGITPIRAMLEDMSGDLAFIYRVLRESDLVFRDELDQLARDRGIALHYLVGDHIGQAGEHLMSPAHLRRLVPDIIEREIYVCGPPAMMQFIEKSLRDADVPRKHIHTERFAL
ncbi:MAG: oxidoreductase [Chloroflexi bacterium]|jgi:predicted ferric reductase|nr:oxidoreductase [Chloroflexota bacterium]